MIFSASLQKHNPIIIMPTARIAMKLKALNSISTIRRQVKIARIAEVGGGTKIVTDDMLSVTIRFAAYVYTSEKQNFTLLNPNKM